MRTSGVENKAKHAAWRLVLELFLDDATVIGGREIISRTPFARAVFRINIEQTLLEAFEYGGRAQENLGDGWGGGMGGALSRKMHLHAARLRFEHPVTGKELHLSAPLPEHMARTWEMLGWRETDCPEDIFEV